MSVKQASFLTPLYHQTTWQTYLQTDQFVFYVKYKLIINSTYPL